ncbi:hypothetical protein LC1Hm_0032 [Halomicrobium sp. LC1Hm]|nr:hypothetical protein LC1Hm_0032 [Halomicrobium sp. LC1Hm]
MFDMISPDGSPSRKSWPFDPNEFVRASRLLEATDEEVRQAIEQVENDSESYQEWLSRKNIPHVPGFVEESDSR